MGDETTPRYPTNMIFIIPEKYNTRFFQRWYLFKPGEEDKKKKRIHSKFKTHKAAASAARLMGYTPVIAEADVKKGGSLKVTVDYYKGEALK